MGWADDAKSVESLWKVMRDFVPAESLVDAANAFADTLEDAGVDPNLVEMAETLMSDCLGS